MRWVSSLMCCLLLSGSVVLAEQTSPASREAVPTIRATSRAVVLDVFVTDKAGKPVHGLKASDFTIIEDGKSQLVRGFEERGPNISATVRPVVFALPPNTYTNYVATQEPGAINILLFDVLNTDRQSLANTRQQLLLYLGRLPSNARVALFTLDWELHLLHGFTDDPRELILAAQQLSSSQHPMYTNARQVSEALAQARSAGLGKSPTMYGAFASFLWAEKEGKEESRTTVTMEALNQLARSMAVFPGRKNLIWISGGLPFDPSSSTPQMKRTAALLAATQIAVYPIDVRGVKFLGADGAALNSEVFSRSGGSYETMSGQSDELLSIHATMTELATLTGGRAYFNRNDLQGAIGDSVYSGSNYYTLAYRPENGNWNGKFRKVNVKVSSPGEKVECRPGYYAVPDPLVSPDINRTFSLAMQPSAPASTTLIMKARVLPPEEAERATRIDFLVDVHDLSFTDSGDHKRIPDVMFVAAAWDANEKPHGSVAATYRQALSESQLESLARTGLQLHEEILLKPGTYRLRLGVVDRLSGKIGTLEVPLTVESKVAKK